MTEREARIAAIRERWRKATTEGPANEFLGEAWNDIPWLLAHLQAAERDRDAAREALFQAVNYLTYLQSSGDVVPAERERAAELRDKLDRIALALTPTPPPEEDAR